jgi:hypothetical protein
MKNLFSLTLFVYETASYTILLYIISVVLKSRTRVTFAELNKRNINRIYTSPNFIQILFLLTSALLDERTSIPKCSKTAYYIYIYIFIYIYIMTPSTVRLSCLLHINLFGFINICTYINTHALTGLYLKFCLISLWPLYSGS